MKKMLTALVCVLIAPLAFGQTRMHHKTTGRATAERITITGTFVRMEEEGGMAANYQPANTLVVQTDGSTPERFVLRGPGHIVNSYGRIIHPPIKPGTHVRVVYADVDGTRVADHVVVED
jgi:hypothetical protein